MYTFQTYSIMFCYKTTHYYIVHLHKSCTNIYSVCYEKCPQCLLLYTHKVLHGAGGGGSQVSFSVRTVVQRQNELFTVYGATLLFPQWLWLCTSISQSAFLLHLNVSLEQSKAQNAKKEWNCPQAKRQAQVHDPAKKNMLRITRYKYKKRATSHNLSFHIYTVSWEYARRQ